MLGLGTRQNQASNEPSQWGVNRRKHSARKGGDKDRCGPPIWLSGSGALAGKSLRAPAMTEIALRFRSTKLRAEQISATPLSWAEHTGDVSPTGLAPRITLAEVESNPAPRSSRSVGNVPRPHPSETGRSCKSAGLSR